VSLQNRYTSPLQHLAAECVVGDIVDKDGGEFGVAAANDVVEGATDVRVDEIPRFLATSTELTAVRCELSVGNGPLRLESRRAASDAAGHI